MSYITDEQIDRICYMATEIRFAKTDEAAQAVIDKIRAVLALAAPQTPPQPARSVKVRITDDPDVAEILRPAAQPAGEPVANIERKVYKHSPEHAGYLRARFDPPRSISFEWDGHRWAYQHTSFDDAGEYDLLWRPGTPQQSTAPAPAVPSDERAAFETEMRCEETWGHRSLKKHPDGRYLNWQVELMWDVWQARAALTAAPTPPAQGEVRDTEAELICAEEVLDSIVAELPDGAMPETSFDCIGDYITAVVGAIKAQPATGWRLLHEDLDEANKLWDEQKYTYADAGSTVISWGPDKRLYVFDMPAIGITAPAGGEKQA